MSCTDADMGSTFFYEDSEEHEGFVKILGNGYPVTLGTNDKSMTTGEYPKMSVKIAHSYFLSKTEVTCSQFAQFSKNFCKSGEDSLPVVNITFWAAVLYANAKSVAEKLDTAYIYESVTYNSDDHAVFLEGYRFNPLAKGFRLPTEAEWVYAAKEDFNVSRSVNAKNSNYKRKKVCSKGPNKVGLCDMEGNVKEWVNDWMSVFRDTTYTDYLGAFSGYGVGQRVIKGGSYKTEPSNINTYLRTDVYLVTSSTMEDYVGFRLAAGAIPEGVFTTPEGNRMKSEISVMASPKTLAKLLGTDHVKLTFRDDVTGNLAFLTYQSGENILYEKEDSTGAYHPVLSPDGKYVVYSSTPEGMSGKSKVHLQNISLSQLYRRTVNMENATIPRFRITDALDTEVVFITDAGVNTNEKTWKSYSTWAVKVSDGKFKIPYKLFDGSYNGGVSSDNRLAVSGARLLRARIEDKNGKVKEAVWYNGEQACNVSLSKGNTKKTLFLDFGGKTGREFAGADYGTHERILVMDSTGKLISAIPSPAGYSFDHTEWVNDNFVVATLVNGKGAHESVVLVNMKDSSIVRLVEGDESWHPDFWVYSSPVRVDTNSFTLDADSAGVYYTQGTEELANILRYKMELLWVYHDSLKIAIAGSSRPMMGVNPHYIKTGLSVNFAHTPNDIYITRDFVKHYFLPYCPQLKFVVVSLDIDFWNKKEGEDWKRTYGDIPGYAYDFERTYREPEEFKELLYRTQMSYGNDDDEKKEWTAYRGYTKDIFRGWKARFEVEGDTLLYKKNASLWDKSLKALEEIISLSKEKGVKVVGIIFPMAPEYKNTGSYGPYGLMRSAAPKVIENIQDLEREYSNFYLMDENKMGNHDYSDSSASNRDHLSFKGGMQLTLRLDSLLKKIDKE